MTENKLYYSYLALLIWLPLPLGSNRVWAWSLMEYCVFSLGLWAAWLQLTGGMTTTQAFRQSKIMLVLFAAWMLLLLLQITPLPAEIVKTLSFHAHQIYLATEKAMGVKIIHTVSVDRHSSVDFILKSLSYGILFGLALLLINNRKRMQQLMWILVISGVIQALYGSLMVLSGLEFGFFFEKENYRGTATGTFINRNHLAGYLEMCLAIGIGLMLAQPRNAQAINSRQQLRNILRWILSPKMCLRIMLAIMVIGLVLTRSRMGNTGFFTSLLICGSIWVSFSSAQSKQTALILLTSLLLIDVYIVGTWFGFDKVINRLQNTSAESESRDEAVKYGLNYISDFELWGSGGGSFYCVFPQYRHVDIQMYYNHAHNDYLQITAETGLLGFILSGCMVIVSIAAGLNALKVRRNPICRGVAFAGLMGVFAILIHSLVDFNLQIPANSALFVVLLSCCWLGQGYSTSNNRPV